MPQEQSTPSRLAPLTLVAAGVASAVTTVVIARFGLAGTILGAALAPVLVALVGEGVRRPAERVRSGTTSVVTRAPREPRRPRFSLDRVSWRRVGAIGVVSFAAVVAAFTVFDLTRGESPVSERGTTFFTPRSDGGEEPAPAPAGPGEQETPPAPPPPSTDTQPPPTVTEPPPPPTTTEPAPPTETAPPAG